MSSTSRLRLGRVLVTLGALATTVVPLIADANATHALNPRWPPHARYHGALCLSLTTLLGLTALWLVWGKAAPGTARLRGTLAAWLAGMFWLCFFPALAAPGVSTWPDGAPAVMTYAPNTYVAGLIVLICLAGGLLLRRAPEAGSA